LEAVVSCTFDGLVVCFRRARPLIPQFEHGKFPTIYLKVSRTGLFAVPWATQPVYFPPQPLPPVIDNYAYYPGMDVAYAPAACVRFRTVQVDLMHSIREMAVFAWALTGINDSLADYAVGNPTAESQPPDGFPIWNLRHSSDSAPWGPGNANNLRTSLVIRGGKSM